MPTTQAPALELELALVVVIILGGDIGMPEKEFPGLLELLENIEPALLGRLENDEDCFGCGL